jgi:hypothetical protein
MVDIMASTRELFGLINSWGFRELLGPQSFIHPSIHAYIHISIHDQNYFYTLDILIHLFQIVEEEFPKGQKKVLNHVEPYQSAQNNSEKKCS